MEAAGPIWPGVLAALVRRHDLDPAQVEAVMEAVLSGEATDAQIAGFAVGLRAKGETPSELAAMVRTMLRYAEPVVVDFLPDPSAAVDIVGTGGDRARTVNISTVASFVVAGCGVPVVKHGNRAASSACGSADVLEALGVAIDLGPEGVAGCVAEAGIGFCFAPRFHPAMRFAGPARRELGVPTSFNFLGPLANPARVRRQVIGVSDPAMAGRMVRVLAELGSRRALVVFSHDGLDELTTTDRSTVHELDGERVSEWVLDPADLGLARADRDELVGGDPDENAAAARRVLAGEPGPVADVVALNAAAGLLVAGAAGTLADGLVAARRAIADGRAAAALEGLVRASRARAGDES